MSNPQPESTPMPAEASDIVEDHSPPSSPDKAEDRRRSLYQAAVKGDWEAADSIFLEHPDASKEIITSRGETALHVATDFGRTEFIEKLVEVMSLEALEIKELDLGHTALHNAAIYGNLSIVKTLVTKNDKLTKIKDNCNYTPLYLAAYYFASKEVLWYLILKVPDVSDPQANPFFANGAGGTLIGRLIASHSYDICLYLLDKYPSLATARNERGQSMLFYFALRPSGFPSGSKLGFWESCIYQLIPMESHHKVLRHSLSRRSDLEDQRAKEPPTLLHHVISYLTQVMHWINGASWTAIEYLVPRIKHIKDNKYRHKCTKKMVEIACEQIAGRNEKHIISYFKSWSILKVAAQNGAVELITACLQHFPYLIWHIELIEDAVLHRQERVFNLFLGDTVSQKFMTTRYDGKKTDGKKKENIDGKNTDGKKKENIDGKKKDRKKKENIEGKQKDGKKKENIDGKNTDGKKKENVDEKQKDRKKKENIEGKQENGKKKENIDGKKKDGKRKENIAHKAARLAPFSRLSSVSCPALQMQRELQWFKAVEKLVNPTQRSIKILSNEKWETTREIFTTEHRELLKDAERWMKDTSNSCMVVSTLIATVVFAAAFTVPGGNVEGKGIPLFLDDVVFLLFAASDALALFSSTTSILMFLSILTARYAEDDFLRALPKRLILGFASLFLAIANLMVAFGATLYMVLSVRFKWLFIPIMAVTTIPVALFVMLQLPLFIYMVRSTYGSGIFYPEKIW